MNGVQVRLLGEFAVIIDGELTPRDAWGRRSASALVKMLALAPGHRLHREQVIESLWPDVPPDRAISRLHKAAFFARRAIPDAVAFRDEMVSLFPRSSVMVDVDEFENLAKTALSTRNIETAMRALALYGALLPEDQFEPWIERRADALRLRCLELLHLTRRWSEILDLDPTDEAAHLALARQHVDAGNRRAAMRQLDLLERALDDLGLRLSTEALQLRADLNVGGDARETEFHSAGRNRSQRRFESRRANTAAHSPRRFSSHPRTAPAEACNPCSTCS